MKKRLENLAACVRELLAALSIPDNFHQRQEPCILLSCHDVDRSQHRRGAHFSPILAPIGEYFRRCGRRVVNLTHPLTFYRSREVYGGAISVNRGFVIARYIQRLETPIMEGAQSRARGMARRIALYRSVLERSRAERVFSIQPPHELCCAAHELDIPVIEAMHGMNLNPSDRIFRESLEGVEDHMLPSVYLTFDARTQATLTALLKSRPMRVMQLPHPWHVEVQRPRSPLRADVSGLDALLRRYRAAVLITLQWGYAGERPSLSNIIPNGVMHPALEEAIAATPTDVLWLVRLHPIQLKSERYRAHRAFVRELARRQGNLECALASSLALPTLLARCHGHVTMISGAVGEAALLGVPSLMLCPTLKPGGAHAGWFSELIDIGIVTLGELDAYRIAAWVAARVEQPTPSPRTEWWSDRMELERRLDELLK